MRHCRKQPEVVALQETKLPGNGPDKKQMEVLNDMFPEYGIVWNSSVEPARKGYAGTMFLYKNSLDPTVDFPKIGAPGTLDFEGRIITLEFEHFYLTQVYTPNAGEGLSRLKERQIWDIKFADYLEKLDKEKYVVVSGDFNVSHREIDLAHPGSNRFSAGFTEEEREGFTNLLKEVSQIHFVIYMEILRVFIPGGPSLLKQAKPIIQDGESTTGW